MAADRVAELIAQGNHAAAAAAARSAGDLVRAQELYEAIWDFSLAAEVAAQRGDRPARLRLLLAGGDVAAARLLLPEVHAAETGERAAAAAVLETRRLWEEAARLRESLGELSRARALFDQARLPLEVARLCELLGEPREAGLRYEEVLAAQTLAPQAEPGDAARSERLRAHLGLSRVLGQFGRREDVVRHLQQARRLIDGIAAYRSLLGDIDSQLVVALAGIGLPGPAHVVLVRLYRRDPERGPLPTLSAFLAAHRPAPDQNDQDQQAEQAEVTKEPARSFGQSFRSRGAAADGTGHDPARTHAAGGTGHDPARGDAQAFPVLLDRYAVSKLLGSGGMGRVYLAHDRLRGEQVAVKLVPPPSSYRGRGGHSERDDSYGRFVREARLMAALRHPAIVRVIDFHEEQGLLVMEHMAGGALSDRRLPLPAPLARKLLLQVLDGLQAAHGRGVIHRDVKPDNIFFTATMDAKLGDFGVAHLQDLGLTQTAGFVGTLAYMAPEQISGGKLSFATDIYSLGVTAFQLATGRLPFSGPDFVGQHLGETPPRPSELVPGISPVWDELCRRALGKTKEERFESLDQMRKLVETLPRSESTPPRAPAAMEATGATPVTVPAAPATTHDDPAETYRIDARIDPRGDRDGDDGEGQDRAGPAAATLYLGTDVRLGRQVIIERFAAGWLQGEAGAAQLRWLYAMAQHGGPHLQRVLRIDLSRPEAQVVYEAPVGARVGGRRGAALLSAGEARRLRRVLRGLHHGGAVHGAVARSVVREEAQVVLLLAGRGPRQGTLDSSDAGAAPTPTNDLRELAALCADDAGEY